jgi:predicted site-specific integrase-resolvase
VTPVGSVALYARVSSADQKPDLERQLGRLTEQAVQQGFMVSRSVSEIGSNGHRPKLLKLRADPGVTAIMDELKGKILSATVSRVADRWFVSVTVEVAHQIPVGENQAVGASIRA